MIHPGEGDTSTVRSVFIVDPNNEIQFVSVTAGSVGRNVDEVLRVLDALQSDELCACNWKKGDPTINAGEPASTFNSSARCVGTVEARMSCRMRTMRRP